MSTIFLQLNFRLLKLYVSVFAIHAFEEFREQKYILCLRRVCKSRNIDTGYMQTRFIDTAYLYFGRIDTA